MDELRKAMLHIEDMRDVGASRLKHEAPGTDDRKAVYIGYDDLSALNFALEALREKLERENSPKPEALTLEQLREVVKEPLRHWVWIENIESPRDSGYMRTHSDYTEGKSFCCGYPGCTWAFSYDNYGKTWLAYATKPETEGD